MSQTPNNILISSPIFAQLTTLCAKIADLSPASYWGYYYPFRCLPLLMMEWSFCCAISRKQYPSTCLLLAALH